MNNKRKKIQTKNKQKKTHPHPSTAGGVASEMECLHGKCEALSSNLDPPKKKNRLTHLQQLQ
jgi:hypothetical protein